MFVTYKVQTSFTYFYSKYSIPCTIFLKKPERATYNKGTFNYTTKVRSIFCSCRYYRPYHPTKKHSTKLSLSTTKPRTWAASLKTITRKLLTTTPHYKTDATAEKKTTTSLITSVIYKANVTTDIDKTGKNYIRLTEGTFKQQYTRTQHKLTFRNRKYAHRTELAKHIWKLKDNKENYEISWSIISSASAYNNISKRCNLCLTEKLHIIKTDKARILNKRKEVNSSIFSHSSLMGWIFPVLGKQSHQLSSKQIPEM